MALDLCLSALSAAVLVTAAAAVAGRRHFTWLLQQPATDLLAVHWRVEHRRWRVQWMREVPIK